MFIETLSKPDIKCKKKKKIRGIQMSRERENLTVQVVIMRILQCSCLLEHFKNHFSLNLGGMYSMHYWYAYQFASLINRTPPSI